jgi:hypothetical protein
MMIDTLHLFDSLDRATEFRVTEDHLKLLRHAYYVYWDPGEGYGAAAINPKKPYGNSDVPQDVAKILEAPDSDWDEAPDSDCEWDDEEAFPPGVGGRFKILRADAADRFLRLHVEAGMALKIALATGEFQSGRYTRTNGWSNDWMRQEP